jgi:hypothetical protein
MELMLDDGDGPAVGIETRCARRRLAHGNPLTTRGVRSLYAGRATTATGSPLAGSNLWFDALQTPIANTSRRG